MNRAIVIDCCRWWHVRALAIAVVIACLGRTNVARGDGITEVTIDSHGPSQDLPLRSSFYLVGDAEKSNLQAVQPIFVRISWPVWGGLFVKEQSCEKIRANLGDLKPDGKLFSGSAGVVTIGEVWKAPKGDLKANDKVVYVPTAWKRADGDKTFKVLVGQPSFFQPGARYCMYLYEQHQLDEAKILAPIKKYASDRISCRVEANPKICEQAKIEDLDVELKKLLAEIPDETKRKEALKTIEDSISDKVSKIVDPGHRLDAAFSSLSACVRDPVESLPGRGATDYLEVDKTPLLQAVLRLVARTGKKVTFHNKAFYDEEEKIAGKFAGFTPELDALRIAKVSEPRAKDRKSISLDWPALLVPGTSTSLLDVIRYTQGTFGKESTTIVLNGFKTPRFQVQLPGPAELDKMKASARALRDALTAIDSPDGDVVLVALREWLQSLNSACCCAEQPLLAIETSIQEYQDSLGSIDAATSTVSGVTVHIDLPVALPVQVRMTQKDFITSYVTPTLGYGTLVARDSSLYYGALQVFFWPSPVDEPMWSHGTDDLRRFFAVELGLALKKDSFGPHKQYSGFDNTPPVFVGVAAQLAPYATFSFGRVWFASRRTSLQQEQPDTTSSFYCGLSVQANVPDIIRSIAAGSTTTTASNAK